MVGGKATPLSKVSTQVNTGKLIKEKLFGSVFKAPISRFGGSILTGSSNKNKQFSSVSRRTSSEKTPDVVFGSKHKGGGLYTSVSRNARFLGKTPSSSGIPTMPTASPIQEGEAMLYTGNTSRGTPVTSEKPTMGPVLNANLHHIKQESRQMQRKKRAKRLPKSNEPKPVKMSDHFEKINLKEDMGREGQKAANFPEEESDPAQLIKFMEEPLQKKKMRKVSSKEKKPTKMSLKKLSKQMNKVRYQTSLRSSPKPKRIKSCFDFSPKRFMTKTRGSTSGLNFTLNSTKGLAKGLSIRTHNTKRSYYVPGGAPTQGSAKNSKLECFLSSTYKSSQGVGGKGFGEVRRSLRSSRGKYRPESKEQVNIYNTNFTRKQKRKSVFTKKKKKQKLVIEQSAKMELVEGDESPKKVEEKPQERRNSQEKTGRSNISNVNINQININNINTIDKEFYQKCKQDLINNIGEIIMKSSNELSLKNSHQYQSYNALGQKEGPPLPANDPKIKGEIDLIQLKNNICKEFENSLKFRTGSQQNSKENLFLGLVSDQMKAAPSLLYGKEKFNLTHKDEAGDDLPGIPSNIKFSSVSQQDNRPLPLAKGRDVMTPMGKVVSRKTHGTGDFTHSVNRSKMASISEIIGQFEHMSKISGGSPEEPNKAKVRRVATLTTELKNPLATSQERQTRTNLQEKEHTRSPINPKKRIIGLNEEKVREINRKLFTQDPSVSSRRVHKEGGEAPSKQMLSENFGPTKNVELRSYNEQERVWETETGTALEKTKTREPLSDLDIFITDIHKKSLQRIEEVRRNIDVSAGQPDQAKAVKSLQISANKVNPSEINEKVFYLRKNLSNKKKSIVTSNPARKFCLMSLLDEQAPEHPTLPVAKKNPFDSSYSTNKPKSPSCQQEPQQKPCVPGLEQGLLTSMDLTNRCLTQRKPQLKESRNSNSLVQLFDISHLDDLSIQFFISKFTLFLQIYCLVEKKQDFYIPLKNLSEMIQQSPFDEVLRIFRTVNSPNPLFCNFPSGLFAALQKSTNGSEDPFPQTRIDRLKRSLERSFELEATSVLLLFFLFVEGKNQFKTLRILELVAHNCFVFLSLLKRVFAELEWKPRELLIDNFLTASNAINAFKTVQQNVSTNFEKNSKVITSQVQILLSNHRVLRDKLDFILQPRKPNPYQEDLKKSIETIFRIFYDQLAQKGLITVSGSKEDPKPTSLVASSTSQSQQGSNLKSVLSKKKRTKPLLSSSKPPQPQNQSLPIDNPKSEFPPVSEVERQRREICFGASKELKNILSQSETQKQRTFAEQSRTDRRNESIFLTGKEKQQLDVNQSREKSREVAQESFSEVKSMVNTSMKVMNLSKNLSITDSTGRHSQLLGISLANNRNSYMNGKARARLTQDLSSLMDKTFTDIMHEKAKHSSVSHCIKSQVNSPTNKSFKKKTDLTPQSRRPNDDTGNSLKHMLERKHEQGKVSSFSTSKHKAAKRHILKKYASSNLENFVIEEEARLSCTESETSKSSENDLESGRKLPIGNAFVEESSEGLSEAVYREDHSEDPYPYEREAQLEYATEVVGYCLESESKTKLFKVTEEDTHHEKFSITVNSDRFRTNSKINSEMNSLKKKANESEALIKDIYQVDLEQENFKKMIQADIKISAHGQYEEMSSSNDAKFTTYKSDMRNKHFNTQINENSELSGIETRGGDEGQGRRAKEGEGGHSEEDGLARDRKEEAILEGIQESFSDHENLQDEEDDDDAVNVESSCIRETYTVDSSSDDQELNERNEADNSLFPDLSQIKVNYDEPNFILQPFYKSSYLPKQSEDKKGWPCLVLDLDETLIHFQEDEDSGQFLIRPYSKEFLIQLSKFYEIVIFTAAKKEYADFILDRLDEGNNISHRLYRRHCVFQNDIYLKDLSQIGRPLERTMIVDNNPESFLLQPENGVLIKSWYDDVDDTALEELEVVLFMIIKSQMWDLRRALRSLRKKILKRTQKLALN